MQYPRAVRFLLLLLLLGWQGLLLAAPQTKIQSFRYWTHPNHTRLVFELTGNSTYELLPLKNPDRLVIDIRNASLQTDIPQFLNDHPQVKAIRTAARNGRDLRVVLDLKTDVKPRSFILEPSDNKPYRLAVDLYHRNATEAMIEPNMPKLKSQAAEAGSIKVQAKKEPEPAKSNTVKVIQPTLRDLVIAIDAGHGGHDPGARGARGTNEKDVVLAIAKRLAKYVSAQPGMKPVLIRSSDTFVELRDRQARARNNKADMFISIHADANDNRSVRGSSVYILSSSGASTEQARWLAKKENAALELGGIEMEGRDPVIQEVLLDLSVTATQEASQKVAKNVIKNLGMLGKVHSSQVQRARFMVLKSLDIPSILVETAFISNTSEEAKLRNSAYQDRIARAIYNGVVEYYSIAAPQGTIMATTSRKHVISRGETLSGIAMRYGVTTRQIQASNSMSSTQIRIGQVLQIPAGG